jgi:uncharacterized membrane protein YecN with MAPEG domain
MTNPQNSEEYERQMSRRRKQNRIALLGIGVILLIILAFSQVPGIWIYALGIFVVVGILLLARAYLERRYKERERIAREALNQDEPKE